MADSYLLNEIIERLSIFKNMYDIIRLVDPFTKCPIEGHSKRKVMDVEVYFDFWRRNCFCENCISMRAYLEKDTFYKIEYIDEKVFYMMACPVKLESKEYIVELIKDVTEKGFIPGIEMKDSENLEQFILDMNEKVITDELTKVYNRRYINERLSLDISNSIANNVPISVIMADIDFFKRINDNYGHLVGDKILKDFALFLKESVRSSTDWIGRYGGEEFLIVLNNTDSNNSWKVTEKIRKGIEEHVFKYDGIEIKITASFGIHCMDNTKLDIESLIGFADKNLYKAKTSGRNKTVIS